MVKDIWNAKMCIGAKYSKHDIPFCPTTAIELPHQIIVWDEAKRLYKENLKRDSLFHCDAFVSFYEDDYKFDGTHGIWNDSKQTLAILRHFAGAITPDFSTYQDFPEPIKLYNTYRMRAYGYWLGRNGIPVINNVRWGTPETFWYCFDGIPTDSIISIGTVGGSPRKLKDRGRFEIGLEEMMHVLHPKVIIVYGSANYPCFRNLEKEEIEIIAYPSQTANAYAGRNR